MSLAQKGLAATTFGCVSFLLYQSYRKVSMKIPIDPSVLKLTPTKAQQHFAVERQARTWDSYWDLEEWLTGVTKWRAQLIPHAKGSVLEVAAGTNRNLRYYADSCELTLVDTSEYMVQQAQDKYEQLKLEREQIGKNVPKLTEVKVGDTLNLEFPENSFDTVVDTYGFGAYDNTERALDELIRVCKPGGQILLLQHSESSWRLWRKWQNVVSLENWHQWGFQEDRKLLPVFASRTQDKGDDDAKDNPLVVDTCKRKSLGTELYLHFWKGVKRVRKRNVVNRNRPSLLFTGLIVDIF